MKFFLFILLFFTTKLSLAQSGWVWLNTAINVGGTSGGGDAVVDGNGNLYVTGYLDAGLNFGPVTLTTTTFHNFFLAKYAPSGSLLWAVTAISSSVNTVANGIDIDTAGNVVVVGTTSSDTITFGNLTVINPQPGPGAKSFIVKYSPTGTAISASIVATQLCKVGHDAKGNMYLAGKYYGTPTLGTITLPSSSMADIFVAKCSPTGTFLWVTTGGSNTNDDLSDLVVNHNGDAVILGAYSGAMTLGNTTTVSGGSLCLFLSKIDSSGNVIWSTSSTNASNSHVQPNNISKDINGDLYISGSFVGPGVSLGNNVSLSYDPAVQGDPNCFFARYNTNGTPLWATSVGGQNFGGSAAPDPSGIVHVSGTFISDTIRFGNIVIGRPPTAGQIDAYIAKYDTSGNFLGAFISNGVGSLPGYHLLPDFAGGFYAVGGYASQTLSLGNVSLPPGTSGMFVARYGVCTVPPPQLGNIIGSSSTCFGKQYIYSVPAVPGAISYAWSLPSGWTGTSSSNTITATAGQNGNILVSASNGCGSTPQLSKAVVVNPVPNPTITQSGLLLSTAPGQGTYQWYLNNIPITGATNNSLLATVNGAYYVRVVNSSNCSDTSNTIVVTQVGIDDVNPAEIKVYPQPNKGLFTIEMPEQNTDCTISIYNLLGVEMPKKVTSLAGKLNVEIQNKQPGIYFLVIEQETHRLSRKIIIE